jgi:hypothetical protein
MKQKYILFPIGKRWFIMAIKKPFIFITKQVDCGYDIYRIRIGRKSEGRGLKFREVSEKVKGWEVGEKLLQHLIESGREGFLYDYKKEGLTNPVTCTKIKMDRYESILNI